MQLTYRICVAFAILLATTVSISSGCQIEGINNWIFPHTVNILDTFRGSVIRGQATNIEALTSVSYNEGLNGGPYLQVTFQDSIFEITTNNAYPDYEEYETEQTMGLTVDFRCSNGNVASLIFLVSVQDTNNNPPQFLLTNDATFKILPPLPPGYSITGCNDDVTVRDIDLTTQRIDFAIEDNPYFEIAYDSSTVPKEFQFVLRTKTFVRTLPEPLSIWISATDVDQTQDPPHTTNTTIRIEADSDFEIPEELLFTQTFYLVNYTDDHRLISEDTIALRQGFDDQVLFSLDGEHAEYFEVTPNNNEVSLSIGRQLPDSILLQNKVLLIVKADREFTSGASATIIIYMPEVTPLEFEEPHYVGKVEDNYLELENLIINKNESFSVTITGDHSSYFNSIIQGNGITLTMAPLSQTIIANNNFLSLQVIAVSNHSSALTVVTLEIIKDDNITPVFERALYTGTYETATGLVLEDIVLVQGYDETVVVFLEGEHADYFQLANNGPVFSLTNLMLPTQIIQEQQLLLTVVANKPRSVNTSAVISITLPAGSNSTGVFFEKILYEGNVQSGAVQHEDIIISGYNGTEIDILGHHSSFFTASILNGVVNVSLSATATLPNEVTLAILELHVSGARAVLLLEVIHSEVVPELPTVTFDSPLYNIQIGIEQTGLIGRVQATADNGETVSYSLLLENAHLLERLSINNEGELRLSAPTNSGVYQFQVVATTIVTRATGTTSVQIIVETTSVCADGDIVVPPLIVLDRDEEEPHMNLVVLNGTEFEGCRYSLTNRWPVDQTWLYVDDNGLHATAIDREHESIAFMALSQIQVELVLHCDSDGVTRKKRSTERLDWLGPYDYGTKNWILTDTILYNSRRSFVNLIVNDINDNSPIFVGKENEPIAVGYPVPELVEAVMPRALAELQATDADIGENAALMYWSSEPVLSVAPTTGFVHVRDGAVLNNDQILTVNATDRYGKGLTGSIDIMVKLLNINNIAVITVRDSFLDHEDDILGNISAAVGYDVKPLRSVILFDESSENDQNTRNKRDIISASGASLQIYVYGLIEREPVHVDILTEDIDNNEIVTVSIAGTISLEDYLEGREVITISGRDTGLLVATIVLSILLFILVVAFIVWFILSRRKQQNYDQFSDENSLGSQVDSLDQTPKPENLAKPRLNIDELKRSERRLQEMLDAPFEEVTVQPTTSGKESPVEAIVKLSSPDSNLPIVIQSIDKLKDAVDESEDDDEFGERKTARRKSVVTFNENVEKIIHVEDVDPTPQVEVYKL